MKTVTLFLIFIGCYALYSTSEKALLIKNTRLQKWFHNNKRNTKIIGTITLLISLLLSITLFWSFCWNYYMDCSCLFVFKPYRTHHSIKSDKLRFSNCFIYVNFFNRTHFLICLLIPNI